MAIWEPFTPCTEMCDRNRIDAPALTTPRSEAIAVGLLRSRRAEPPVERVGEFLRLRCLNDPRCFYVIISDGSRLLRTVPIGPAHNLAPSFADAMYRVGSAESGLHCVASRSERTSAYLL